MKKLRNKKGFTLIELIVVIAILAILAAILIPAIINYIDQAEVRKDLSNARSIYSEAMLDAAVAETPKTTSSLGGVECIWTVTNKTVSDFKCTNADGALTLDFLTN